jgi:hypothetical protein
MKEIVKLLLLLYSSQNSFSEEDNQLYKSPFEDEI